MMLHAAIVISSLVVLMTLLPFLSTGAWWVRAFDFPRVQIAVFCAVLIAFWGFRWQSEPVWAPSATLALACCLVYQVVCIWPYTSLHDIQALPPAENRKAPVVRLVSSNVLMENRESQRFIEVMREAKPDVLLALEPDSWWEQQLRELESDFAHVIKQPQSNHYGLMLFSNIKIRDYKIRFLVDDDVPSIFCVMEFDNGETFDLYGVHPQPPHVAKDSTDRDAELVLVAREVKKAGRPSIVVGDLNDVAWSTTTEAFQQISGLLDPRIGRGMFNTFNANVPLLRYPLDHCFYSSDFRFREMRRLPKVGSDHFPILLELSYEPDAKSPQDKNGPDGYEEAAEVTERLQEEGAPTSPGER